MPRMVYPCVYDIVCGASVSAVCIGEYSALPSAKLLALGIMQSGLLSALAEPQFCLCAFNMGVSVVIWLY